MRARAGEGWVTITELADTLARDHGLSFRAGHGIAARVVRAREADPHAPLAEVVRQAAVEVAGREIPFTEAQLDELLSPEHFVAVRRTLGGPAPEVAGAALDVSRSRLMADAARLDSDDAYRDIAVRFVTASLQGWAYCRDNVEECRNVVVAKGSKLGDSHQLWQMNEINKLIWPADGGVGVIDEAAWDRTVQIAMDTQNLEGATVLTAPPTDGAWTNDIVNEALANLQDLGVDTTGSDFQPTEVTLVEGGN